MAREIPELTVEEYGSGESVLTLARKHRVGTQRMIAFLRDRGVLRTPGHGRSIGWSKRPPETRVMPKKLGKPLDSAAILAMFESGKTCGQIGSLLGVGARRVRALLTENGLIVRDDPRRCVSCNAPIDDWHGGVRVCLTCAPDQKHRANVSKYGVPKQAYDSMLTRQGGHCALCHRTGDRIDHDHATGRVRGVICNGCNFALSRLDEDREWTARALRYIDGGD